MGNNRIRKGYISTYPVYIERNQHLLEFRATLTTVNNFMSEASHIHIISYFHCSYLPGHMQKFSPSLKIWLKYENLNFKTNFFKLCTLENVNIVTKQS